MHEHNYFQTLLPGLEVVSAFSSASVVLRVSVDSCVEFPAYENMYNI